MNYNKIFEQAKALGIEELELNIINKKKMNVSVFHSKVEKYSVSSEEILAARGIVEGKMGVAYTENLKDIDSLLAQIVSNASIIEEKKEVFIYEGDKKYARSLKYNDSFEKASVNEKIELCLKGEKLAFSIDPRICEVESTDYEENITIKTIINSKGLKLRYKRGTAYYFVSVVAKENEDVKTAYNYEVFDDFSKIDVERIVKEAVSKATSKLGATPCDSRKYKTILAPNVVASFLHVLMDSVNGKNVTEKRSTLIGKLDQLVASKKLTIIDNPLFKENMAYYRNFDDEGVATYAKPIIERGILRTFLFNLETAKKAGVHSTGNGYKESATSSVGVEEGFLVVKEGKKSLDELYQEVGDGIVINDVQGLHAGINSLSGNFSLQASGYLVKDGKRGTPVNLITVAGNLFDMLMDIKEVSTDSRIVSSMKCPSIYVKSLAISGK